MTFNTIALNQSEGLFVTWDLGRRCNYDCTYCPSHRHDNFSPHADLEILIGTIDFIYQYAALMAEHRKDKKLKLSFTGGEPTVHPKFIEFVDYLPKYYQPYENKIDLHLSLTTNGAMSKRIANSVIERFNAITISYHTEANVKLKTQVVDRIYQFHESDLYSKVNVMFHAQEDLFDECRQLCERLEKDGVRFVPRIIGDEGDRKESLIYKRAHEYTTDQMQWFKDFWDRERARMNTEKSREIILEKKEEKMRGELIGRPCCGKRPMRLKYGDVWENSNFVEHRQYKDWFCSVNWFFLHLEQQTDRIFHHQTCQATFDKSVGPIGTISDRHLILEKLRSDLSTNSLPVVVCPNKFCGCGLCAPKSNNIEDFLEVSKEHYDTNVLAKYGKEGNANS